MNALFSDEVIGEVVLADLLVQIGAIGLAFAYFDGDNAVSSVLCLEDHIVNLGFIEHFVAVFVTLLQVIRANHLVVGG